MSIKNAEIPEDVRLVQEYMDGIAADASEQERREAEQFATEFAFEIEDEDRRQAAFDVLIGAVKHRSPELRAVIEERNEAKFGRGVAEVSLGDLKTGIERVMAGKNSGLVIRASEYEDLSDDVLGAIKKFGDFDQQGEPIAFPNEIMRRNHRTSSALHLDIVTDGTDERFPTSLSASVTEKGSVVFTSGLASKKVRGWDQSEYDFKKGRMSRAPSVRRMDRFAEDGNPPKKREWTVREHGLVVDLTAVVLNPGDIAIWPQGGAGVELPAWHGFRQIGREPRQSTTYHFGRPATEA